ncbi:MAG: L,D-transpeptidase [Gammaproteobacteria bacterium]
MRLKNIQTIVFALILGCTLGFDANASPIFAKYASHSSPTYYAGTFVFNPKTHSFHAYDSNGHLVKSGIASGGQNYCSDLHRGCHTPVGTFFVYSKGGAGCKSSKFPLGKGGAPMPYCMFFHGNYAIHGSYHVSGSKNLSHGCIRVTPNDALWLTRNFMKIGTKVIVLPY